MIEKAPPEVERQEIETLTDGRYLLFDSGCDTCASIAQDVEREANGWLKALSLKESVAQTLLSKARPGWKWEPALLEVRGEKTIVSTGPQMKVRMVIGLGPRRAVRVARIARRETTPDYEFTLVPSAQQPGKYAIESIKQIDRRTALKAFGAFGVATVMLPWLSGTASAQETDDEKLRVESEQLSSREAEKEFERAARRNPNLRKLQRSLREKGFTSRAVQQGTKVKTVSRGGRTRRVNASWINRVYKHRNGESAVLSVTTNRLPNPDKVRCDYSVYTRAGGLDTFKVRGGAVKRTGRIKNLKAARRRFYRRGQSLRRDQSSGADISWRDSYCVFSSATGCVTSCEVCYAAVAAILGIACEFATTSALVALACPPPATLACIGIMALAAACACFIAVLVEDGYTAGWICNGGVADLC